MEISNRAYLISHGKEPRGTGRWAFSANRNNPSFEPDASGYDEVHWTPYPMTLTAAKAWLRRRVGRNHLVYYVLP